MALPTRSIASLTAFFRRQVVIILPRDDLAPPHAGLSLLAACGRTGHRWCNLPAWVSSRCTVSASWELFHLCRAVTFKGAGQGNGRGEDRACPTRARPTTLRQERRLETREPSRGDRTSATSLAAHVTIAPAANTINCATIHRRSTVLCSNHFRRASIFSALDNQLKSPAALRFRIHPSPAVARASP